MGTGSFPGVKRPGRGVDKPLHLPPRLKKECSYTSTPPFGLRGLFRGELLYFMNVLKKEASLVFASVSSEIIRHIWLQLDVGGISLRDVEGKGGLTFFRISRRPDSQVYWDLQ